MTINIPFDWFSYLSGGMIKPSFKHKTVMLIDDEEIDNFINERVISMNGFSEKVDVHKTGLTAIEHFNNILIVEADSETLMPKYIFLDLNMPLMDAWGFLEIFEKLNVSTKVVILTASVNPADEKRSKNFSSVVSFLSKPLTGEQLSNL